LLTGNQLLIGGVTAGVAVVMLAKASSAEIDALRFDRGSVFRYFLRISLGWLCILAVTYVIGLPVSIAGQIFTSEISAVTSQWVINILSAIFFALLQAGLATLFFSRLLDIASGAPSAQRESARKSFFPLFLSVSLATGLTIGLAWNFWSRDMTYLASGRLIDSKIAVEGLLMPLLSFAAARQRATPNPAVMSVFD
jgi:hypothetical protein